MLSANTFDLAQKLREAIGADKKGIGLECTALVSLWEDRDPTTLRSAIDELAMLGFVRVDKGIGASHPDIPSDYNLRGVVCVTVMEPLQAYLDSLDI